MNDYYCSDKRGSSKEPPYPQFEVVYKIGYIEKRSVVSAKSVDLAKRVVYISESSKGNINVKIIRVEEI